MLRAAALIPPTVLLALPSAPAPFDDVRRRASAEVERLVGAGAERVVVVVPGPVGVAREAGAPVSRSGGAWHPSFRAAGIDDVRSGLAGVVVGRSAQDANEDDGAPGDRLARSTVVDDVPSAVGLSLLARAGWSGPVEVVAAGGSDAVALRDLGRLIGRDDVVLLLVGGLSARRGPGAPLAEDPRAVEVDTAVAQDLASLGRPGAADVSARLAAMDPALALELAISAWAPWQVLLGALAETGPALAAVASVSVPAGATYAVVGWRPQ